MRALVCHRLGGPDDLEVRELPDPQPGPGEIAIAVAAAGVNFADTLMIAGKYQEKPPLPFVPGLEAAGRVVALGAGVENIGSDLRVLALADRGAFAERLIVRASDCILLPDSLDDSTAAGLAITYGTAEMALVERAWLRAGETLLVLGAAGGVGLAAVEVGKALGARVVAVASSREKRALASEHGADVALDSDPETLRERLKNETGGRGVDVVFDPVGGALFDAALRATAWSGRLLTIGFAGGSVPQVPANYLLVKNIAVIGLYWGSYRRHAPKRLAEGFSRLFAWHEEDKIRPAVAHRLPLDKGAEAIKLLTERKALGKVVIEIGARR